MFYILFVAYENQATGLKDIWISLVTSGLQNTLKNIITYQSRLSIMINKITFLYILFSTFMSKKGLYTWFLLSNCHLIQPHSVHMLESESGDHIMPWACSLTINCKHFYLYILKPQLSLTFPMVLKIIPNFNTCLLFI